jgi:predicted transposase YbfD/YdcC
VDHLQYTPLLPFLKAVPDPRKARGKIYPWELLLVGVCGALLSGQLNGSAMAEWVIAHALEIAAFLGIPLRRIPSASTVRRTVRNVDVEALERVMAEHNQALDNKDQASGSVAGVDGQPLRGQAIDGKELRGASAHGEKVHLLAVARHGSGATLAQQEVGEKTNEIPVVPEMLAERDLKGTVITLDALNTQRTTAQLIIRQGGDYLMVVKENQPTLYADIETYFQGTFLPEEDDRDTYTYSGKGHGRLERRSLTCSAGLSSYLDWPAVEQVARRQCWRRVIKLGKVSNEVTYAVTSLDRQRAGARQLEALWRGHWTIENKDHYVRDETLGEDRCQMHRGNAPRALAALRNALLAALRHCGWTNIAAALRYYAVSAQRALAFLSGTAFWQGPARATKASPG